MSITRSTPMLFERRLHQVKAAQNAVYPRFSCDSFCPCMKFSCIISGCPAGARKWHISRFPVNPHYQQQFYLRPPFIAFFNFSHKRPTFAFTSESGYTLGFRRKITHKGTHGETGGVLDGGAVTTLGPFRTFTNIPGPGIRTAHFAVFGSWPGALPKNAKSLRDSDAFMRVAVPRRRGPAGLRCPVAAVRSV